jgi:prepilin-type processing-associated H-X9-DG protein
VAAALALFGLLGAASEPEDELKAATVLSFLRYSDWPNMAAADSPLTVGVLGRPALMETLHRILDGKSVKGRPIRIVEIKAALDPRCCQVAYLAAAKTSEIKSVLSGMRAARILTIGESDHFLDYGGAVNLFFADGHIGFEASLEAIDRAGVNVSSTLLRYGQIKGRRQP